jgi:ribosome maturation factor RimP
MMNLLHASPLLLAQVSSPGAERVLKMPEELSRFGALPLKVSAGKVTLLQAAAACSLNH